MKLFHYEPSIRVPLLMRGPGVRAGLQVQEPVSNADLTPTIVNAASARPDLVLDGQSLLPLTRDPGLRWGRDLLIEGVWAGGDLSSRRYVAIHTPRYIYAEHRTGEREFYDLLGDPDELQSRQDD